MSRTAGRRGLVLLAGAAALAACGDLPQPFRGQPGGVAPQLARPPAYRLAVPAPPEALLTGAEAEAYARLLAEALVAQEVPAVDGPGFPLDWQVVVTATRQGQQIVPRYALRDADGRALGEHAGRAVPVADWAAGREEMLRSAATEAAPAIAALAARVDARRRTGDERAAGAGPPVVLLRQVRGAPGDGNRSLTARMAERLATLGILVQDQADGAGFAVEGTVVVTPVAPRVERVEIIWVVSRRDGYDLGRVLQLNEIPAGTLNRFWGDVALVVAEEAAGGVRDVLSNAGGMPQAEAASPPAPSPAPAPAARERR